MTQDELHVSLISYVIVIGAVSVALLAAAAVIVHTVTQFYWAVF